MSFVESLNWVLSVIVTAVNWLRDSTILQVPILYWLIGIFIIGVVIRAIIFRAS